MLLLPVCKFPPLNVNAAKARPQFRRLGNRSKAPAETQAMHGSMHSSTERLGSTPRCMQNTALHDVTPLIHKVYHIDWQGLGKVWSHAGLNRGPYGY